MSREPASGGSSDRELLDAHVAGDPDAFGVLFSRHRDRLWAVALRTTGSPEDAADALQEAMISAFRRASSFRGDAAVTTWLHRIVVNACLDRLRRRAVRAADPLPDDLEERAARGDLLATSVAADPAEHVVADERSRLLLAALRELPPEQLAALVLVDMEGYPVAEAAAILQTAPGTVKSRCARGRARLASRLSGLLEEAGGTSAPPAASHRGPPGAHEPDPLPQGGEQP